MQLRRVQRNSALNLSLSFGKSSAMKERLPERPVRLHERRRLRLLLRKGQTLLG